MVRRSSASRESSLFLPSCIIRESRAFFFDARGAAGNSLPVFLIFVPGLLFFNTFSALEPVYEAIHQAASLKNLTLWVTTINLLLTSLLVPVAGIQGAAAATMLTMLSHFLLFGRRLSLDLGIEKTTFLTAGLAFYLLYLLLGQLKGYPVLCFWSAPLFLLVLYYGCGLFGVEAGQQSKDRRV